MTYMQYVRRKRDGLYVSVDGGFTPEKEKKAFVFHEGAARSIAEFCTDEYDLVPLTETEVEQFDRLCKDEAE